MCRRARTRSAVISGVAGTDVRLLLCLAGFGSEVAYLGYDSDEEGERKETARVDTGEYRIIHKDKNQQFKSKEEYEKYIGECCSEAAVTRAIRVRTPLPSARYLELHRIACISQVKKDVEGLQTKRSTSMQHGSSVPVVRDFWMQESVTEPASMHSSRGSTVRTCLVCVVVWLPMRWRKICLGRHLGDSLVWSFRLVVWLCSITASRWERLQLWAI